jgi:hypothetical protein
MERLALRSGVVPVGDSRLMFWRYLHELRWKTLDFLLHAYVTSSVGVMIVPDCQVG